MDREELTQIIRDWLGARYDNVIGDTSNPDYFGPKEVEKLVESILSRIGENHSDK